MPGHPRWGLKSNDPDGSELEPIELTNLTVQKVEFRYSDEYTQAQKALEAALKRRKVIRPTMPEHPRRFVDGKERSVDEMNLAVAEYNEAMDAYRAAAVVYNEKGREIAGPIERKALKAFDARMKAQPARLARIGSGWSGNPIQAGNLARRFRILTDADDRALDRLEHRIAALQVERARLIREAWDRGITVTPETLRDIASRPRDKRSRDVLALGRDLLDHVRFITAHSIEKRGKEAA